MDQEPNWTKNFSSEQVCSFFYAFFIIHITVAIIAFIIAILLFFKNKSPFTIFLPSFISLIFTAILSSITALFHYLICQRALLAK